MSLPLQAEVIPCAPVSRVRVAAICGAVGLLTGSATVAMLTTLHQHPGHVYITTQPPAITNVAPTRVAYTHAARAVPAEVAPVRADFAFTFRLSGATYMSLAELPGAEDALTDHPTPRTGLPTHGPLRLVGERNLARAAVATLAAEDLPPQIRTWKGREVVVGGTCLARVTGFSLVSRSLGGWDWMYTDKELATKSRTELAKKLFEVGQAVIAAKLDGCTGTYARAASLPAVVHATPVNDYKLADRARKQLLSSAAGKAAASEWRAAGNKKPWHKEATIKELVVRHPTTGTVYVSVHAVLDEGCGGAHINLWRLYRASAKGALELVQQKDSIDVQSIDELVDLDGDGRFEFIVHDSSVGQDMVLWSANGTERMRLSTPFYGCSC